MRSCQRSCCCGPERTRGRQKYKVLSLVVAAAVVVGRGRVVVNSFLNNNNTERRLHARDCCSCCQQGLSVMSVCLSLCGTALHKDHRKLFTTKTEFALVCVCCQPRPPDPLWCGVILFCGAFVESLKIPRKSRLSERKKGGRKKRRP